jgi:hypothetical protein
MNGVTGTIRAPSDAAQHAVGVAGLARVAIQMPGKQVGAGRSHVVAEEQDDRRGRSLDTAVARCRGARARLAQHRHGQRPFARLERRRRAVG